MLQQTLTKTVSLGLAALMTLATLGAVDHLAVQEPESQLMAAQASKMARQAAQAPAAPRS